MAEVQDDTQLQLEQADMVLKTKTVKAIVAGKETKIYRKLCKDTALHLCERHADDGKYHPSTTLKRIRVLNGFRPEAKYAIVEVSKIVFVRFDTIEPEGFKFGEMALMLELGSVIEHNL